MLLLVLINIPVINKLTMLAKYSLVLSWCETRYCMVFNKYVTATYHILTSLFTGYLQGPGSIMKSLVTKYLPGIY